MRTKFEIIRGLLLAAICLGAASPNIFAADSTEELLGKASAAQIPGAAPLHESASVQRYVNLIGNVVSRAAGSKYKWRFAVVTSDAVNAFAAPGGYILLSSGLLKLLDTESELGYVLSHEIAHVVRRHHYHVIQRQRAASAALNELNEGERDQGVLNVSRLGAQIYARCLDRNAEFEADRLGAEIMTRAGYDPVAAVDVLSKLVALQGNDPRAELLFSTHPSPGERLEQLLSAGIEQLPRPSWLNPAMDKRFHEFRSQL